MSVRALPDWADDWADPSVKHCGKRACIVHGWGTAHLVCSVTGWGIEKCNGTGEGPGSAEAAR